MLINMGLCSSKEILVSVSPPSPTVITEPQLQEYGDNRTNTTNNNVSQTTEEKIDGERFIYLWRRARVTGASCSDITAEESDWWIDLEHIHDRRDCPPHPIALESVRVSDWSSYHAVNEECAENVQCQAALRLSVVRDEHARLSTTVDGIVIIDLVN